MVNKQKDLLGLRGVSAEQITEILDTAARLKSILSAPNKKTPHLQGKSIVTLFYENSTRTRMSFELAPNTCRVSPPIYRPPPPRWPKAKR